MQEGSLWIQNYRVYVKGVHCRFKTIYNRKSSFPFYCEHELVDYEVFDDNGEFTEEFIEFCNNL